MVKVSIIIPNYNRANYIAETVNSVINQTYTNWECIIVDDGSTDNSCEIVQSYKDKDERIQWINRNRLPKGAPTCRNIGVEHANGKYLIFLDSDDLLAPHCLDQRINIMENHPELDLAVFPMQLFNDIPGDLDKVWNIDTEESHLKRFMALDSVWQTTGPIWKKEAFLKTGGFNESLTCWQDVDIHLKAIFNQNTIQTFYTYPIDCYYRSHNSGSISQSNINSTEKLESRKKLYLWAKIYLNNKELANPMAINIIVSAIKSLKLKFALEFLKITKQTFRPKEKALIWIAYFIYLSRLYKINIISKTVNNFYVHLQPIIHVGKHKQ